MRWAVAMRTKRPSARAFKKAFDSGRIVRIHLLRGTWQLIAAEDYWWMLELCAEKGIGVTKGWMSANKISISDEELMSVRAVLCEIVHGLRSATKEEIVRGLAEHGIVMDDHRLSYHIRMAEFHGVLCSGDLLPMKPSWSLTAEKIGPRPEGFDRDASLALLARKYFQSHQPASLEDFVWWSGLSLGDCRRGIELLGDEIRSVRWRGYEFFVLDGCRVRGCKSGCHLLLPSYDEYLIGYKSRELALCEVHRARAHSQNGIFFPVVLHDGAVCGNWSPFGKAVGVEFFDGSDGSAAGPGADLSPLVDQYQRFLKR